MFVGEYLTTTARRFRDKEALVCAGDRYTYQSLSSSAQSLASFLVTHGLETNDRVVIVLDNCPEAVIALFGTLTAGGAFVFVHHLTPPERLAFIIDNCKPKFLITSSQRIEVLNQVRQQSTARPHYILTGTGISHEQGLSFEEAIITRHADNNNRYIDLDVAAIIYTSGSTGKPKGVTLTHRNIDTVVESVSGYLEHSENDIILDFLPLSIGYGLLQLFVTLRNGGTLILEKGFGFPYEIVKKIKQEHVTGFAGVPTVWSIFLSLQNLERENFSSLRYLTNAAAAMPSSFIPKLRKIFPQTSIFLMHGLTECLRTTYLPPDQIEARPTSVGKGMANVEMWIEDSSGKRLSAGEVGELVIRGSNIMQGYWNDPEATAKVLKPGRHPGERVLHTGDLFTVDADGYFSYVARMDDVIKSRGKKISPLEIEEVLYALDEVLEARVIGIPDTLLGQAVKAEIVLKKGKALTEMDVKAYCKQHLEDFQIPGLIEFVASLPKSAGGKIKRVG